MIPRSIRPFLPIAPRRNAQRSRKPCIAKTWRFGRLRMRWELRLTSIAKQPSNRRICGWTEPWLHCLTLSATPLRRTAIWPFLRLGRSWQQVRYRVRGRTDRLRRIGVPGGRIVFSGVGKTREEIRAALAYSPSGNRTKTRRAGIRLFNVESEEELELLLGEGERHARAGGSPPAASIRINPDVLAGDMNTSQPASATTNSAWIGRLHAVCISPIRILPGSCWVGISAHLGSQILSTGPYRQALQQLAAARSRTSRQRVSAFDPWILVAGSVFVIPMKNHSI